MVKIEDHDGSDNAAGDHEHDAVEVGPLEKYLYLRFEFTQKYLYGRCSLLTYQRTVRCDWNDLGNRVEKYCQRKQNCDA